MNPQYGSHENNLNENCNKLLQISRPNSDAETQEATRDHHLNYLARYCSAI